VTFILIGVSGLRGLVLDCGFVSYAVQSLQGTRDFLSIKKGRRGGSLLGRGRGKRSCKGKGWGSKPKRKEVGGWPSGGKAMATASSYGTPFTVRTGQGWTWH